MSELYQLSTSSIPATGNSQERSAALPVLHERTLQETPLGKPHRVQLAGNREVAEHVTQATTSLVPAEATR
jgi:hypothetical protein